MASASRTGDQVTTGKVTDDDCGVKNDDHRVPQQPSDSNTKDPNMNRTIADDKDMREVTDSAAKCDNDDLKDDINEDTDCGGQSMTSASDDLYLEELRLDLLPAEILLHICSFLHARIVVHTLSRVCKSLHSLLTDDTFWKVRIGKKWPKKYPAIPVNDSLFNWKEACIEREEQHRLWSHNAAAMDYYRFTEGVFAPVDAVHLMQKGKLLAVGSRDRYLNLLDLSKLESGQPESIKGAEVFTKMEAHKGWIWSMSSLDSVLATGSWDTYIKYWDLAANGQELRKVKCKSAILCTHFEPDFFVAGGYDKKVYHIDPRSADILAARHYHARPVLCLSADDKYIITGSEDKTVAIYDRRAGSVFKTLQLECFPMSLSYGMDQLWVGDKRGGIHLVDATDGDFNLVQTYDVGHQGHKVTGIVHTLGAMFTCSTDKTIRVLQPTVAPDTIATLAAQKAEVAGIDFQNDVLVSANSDVSVGIWVPQPLDSC